MIIPEINVAKRMTKFIVKFKKAKQSLELMKLKV